jgi:hypothetical protein
MAPEVVHRVTVELLRFEPLSERETSFLASMTEPEFILMSRVTSVDLDAPCEVGETCTFGMADPNAIGLAHWRPGDTIDLLLVPAEKGRIPPWHLTIAKPS